MDDISAKYLILFPLLVLKYCIHLANNTYYLCDTPKKKQLQEEKYMGAYMDYFQDWIQGKNQTYKKLQYMFRMADEGFGMRFGNENKNMTHADVLDKFFVENLKTIEKEWDTYQEELKKMAYLTKGNILLRKGQYLGEHFCAPQKWYQQACVVLEQGYDPEETDFLNLMMQLNLGKYFRNMGRHHTRSDYLRAKDEFKEVIEKIDSKHKHDTFSRWETHIWLEAMVNMGRVERYLYHLEEAKELFLHMISLLLPLSPISISINSDLDKLIYAKKNSLTDKMSKLNGDKELYEDYLIQALVQLGIAYQKSQEYQIAQDICVTVLKMNPSNVDAANNLGVCLRKQGIEESLSNKMSQENRGNPIKNVSKYFNMTYEEIFKELGNQGNRFAKLQHIKCDMHKENPNQENIQKSIEELLKDNADDQEVLLLYGLFWQKFGDFDRSQEILGKLYKRVPQITKGSIGLKAYYNIANNLLRQKNFREAKKYYEHILEVLAKENDCDRESLKEKDKSLSFFPMNDLLAAINLGWCLMNLGDYGEAEKCYKSIWEYYKNVPDNIRVIENKMKIENNLAECLLYLVNGVNERVDDERLNLAQKLLEDVHKKEPNNAIMHRHLGYYHMLKIRSGSDLREEVKEALKHFKKAETYNMEDVYIHTGWVSAVVPPLLNGTDLTASEKTDLAQRIENKLRYSSGVYSIKACAKLASFIVMRENAYGETMQEGTGTGEKDKLLTMYRSLSRIQISKEEEGYEMFRRFIENDEFRNLEAAKRGEILVGLFRLYEQIIKIKSVCRYVQNTGEKQADFVIPVHYTKIDTLKKLLPDEKDGSGKLRLWNTVYMNDSFEGESFIDMMKYVGKNKLDKDQNSNWSVMKMMKRYFPYLNEKSSKNKLLVPHNDNIYVFSFSKAINEIYMWVSYAEDAKGCAITFENDFFDIRKTEDTLTDISSYSDKDYPLYEIQYLDLSDLDRWKKRKSGGADNNENAEKRKIMKILDIMDEMWGILEDLENRMAGEGVLKLNWNGSGNGQKETQMVRDFVTGCLNEVRFLIKSTEYSHEKEIRMFHYSYEPKFDTENFDIPRLYVEMERDIRIKEIKLGSKLSDPQINEIVSWLNKTGKVECITKSERHYK